MVMVNIAQVDGFRKELSIQLVDGLQYVGQGGRPETIQGGP